MYKKMKENIFLLLRGFKVLLKIEKTFVFCILLSNIITAIFPYVNILALSLIINELIGNKNLKILFLYVSISILINIIFVLLNGKIKRTLKIHEEQFFKNEKLMFSIKDMKMEYSQLESKETKMLRKRVDVESQTGYNTYFLYTFLGNVINSTANIISSIALTISLFINTEINSKIKVVILVLVCIVVIISVICSKNVENKTSKMFESFASYNMKYNFYKDFISQYNTGKEIRIYALENNIAEEVKKLDLDAYKIQLNVRKDTLKYSVLSAFSSDFFSSAIYIIISLICIESAIKIGDVIRYSTCLVMFVMSFSNLITQVQMLFLNNKYLTNYFSYLDQPFENNNGNIRVENIESHQIEFKNVYFKYPSSEHYALKNVSFTIKPNEKTAFVGENGSGKTTIVKLLCRFYTPTRGCILLDGKDISKIPYDEYLSILSVTFQDFKLFAFNIGQNVAASYSYQSELVNKCLNKVGFNKKIIRNANGLETYLYKNYDENGIEVSGGEAQKIALARMLYKNNCLFILDEPTAALDPLSEYDIFNRINELTDKKTVLYISHRLYSCRFCNKIIVLDNGSIIQEGTHSSLLEDSSGKYYRMWEIQSMHYNSH